jgi:hypothetical protein
MPPSLSRLLQPLLIRTFAWEARHSLARFHRGLRDQRRIQERTLLEKIRRNQDSAFGRDHGFAAIRSVADFRARLPVTSYEDYTPYIERVRQGDFAAMFGRGQRVHMFAMTSGTTNKPKYIPVPDPFLSEYRAGWMLWGIQAVTKHYIASQGRMRILQLFSAWDDERAPCGLPCGATSGLTARIKRPGARNLYVVPACVAHIKNIKSKYYVAALLALADRITFPLVPNPSTLLGLARAMDQRKTDLLRDLADGTLSPDLDLLPEVRREVQARLRPEPQRARELDQAVAHQGHLYPKTAWQLPLIGCWKGGTLSLYLRDFPRYFGDAPVRDIGLIASEGRMTIPLSNEGTAGVLDFESSFFEFLPARDGQGLSDEPLLSHELEAGREYFLLLTSSAGLYRYNMGDVVRVEGFLDGSPLVAFLNKGAHYSSLTGEKLSEYQAVEAVNAALEQTGLTLASYCLAPTWSEAAPFYSLIVEEDALAQGNGLAALAAAVDVALCHENIEYRSKRDSGRLGPVHVRLAARGAWTAYDLEVVAARRRGIEQYKHKFLANDVEFEKRFPDVRKGAARP